LLTGGERLKGKGYFYKPTIVTNITDAMRVSKEEVFGPLAPITVVENESDAIELANDTKYGLGASVWTQDIEKAEKLARAVQAGVVTVNNIVSSDPRIPFGGIKNSGFGRELSRYGMLEFVNIKSIRFYDQLVSSHHVE
jgi:succinyl-CoA reductase